MLLRGFIKTTKAFNAFIVICGSIGIVLFFLGFYIDYKRSVLSFYVTPIAVTAPDETVNLPLPKKITINDIGIDLPVEERKIIGGVWEISNIGVSHLDTSARPGGGGNIVMYGHNKDRLLGNLINQIKRGQTIKIIDINGKNHNYIVSEIKEVEPDEISEVLPTDHEVLTLYTCSGFLDSLRMVVKALPY